jgi:hypothetical protein
VCPQSPLGVLKNYYVALCVSLNVGVTIHAKLRTNDARIVSTHSSLTPGLTLLLRHKRLTEKRKDGRLFHLSASKRNFQCFAVICRKPHVASSICLRATIFQNPEWTL